MEDKIMRRVYNRGCHSSNAVWLSGCILITLCAHVLIALQILHAPCGILAALSSDAPSNIEVSSNCFAISKMKLKTKQKP